MLSALVNASDVHSNLGLEACTSKQCAWLPAARNVSQVNVILKNDTIIFSNKVSLTSVKDVQFYCPGNKKHRLSTPGNTQTSCQPTNIDLPSELENFLTLPYTCSELTGLLPHLQ